MSVAHIQSVSASCEKSDAGTENLKLSRYVATSDPLTVTRTGRTYRVVFSTRSGAVLVFNERAWQRVENGSFAELPDKMLRQIVDAEVLVPYDEDELATVVRDNMRAIEENDVLYQVVQPTAWCQLGCHYCGQEHARNRLGEDAQRAFLGRVRARLTAGKYRVLKIGWFGAEPLVGLDVMRKLGSKAQALAHEFDCAYTARVVTNGLALTPAVATELVESHSVEEAEITIDGIEAIHDKRRGSKSGRGSFRRIFENLLDVTANTSLKIVVRCNVDRQNADGVSSLIEKLAEAGLAERISFYTSPVYAWGNDAHRAALDRQDYAEREIDWLALQMRLGFRVGLVPPRRKIVCMSVQREGEVVDAYGTTFNCTEVPYVPSYGNPNKYEIELPEGNNKKQPVTLNEAPLKLRDFNEQLLDREHLNCAACPMLPVCGGQCPKAWHEGHEPCPSAKANIRQRLNIMFAVGHAKRWNDGAED